MTESNPSTRAAVDAIVARDQLQLSAEDYQRLIDSYDDLLAELALLRLDNIRDVEPAVVYTAT